MLPIAFDATIDGPSFHLIPLHSITGIHTSDVIYYIERILPYILL